MMANYYRLEMPFEDEVIPKNLWQIDWANQAERESIFNQYPLLKNEVTAYLESHPKYRFDVVLSEGPKLSSCKKSLLMGLLEKYIYPTGLERRRGRFFNDGTLKDCVPK